MTGNDDAKLLILSIAPEELNSHGDLLDLFGTINGDHATIGFNGEAKDCISFDSLV